MRRPFRKINKRAAAAVLPLMLIALWEYSVSTGRLPASQAVAPSDLLQHLVGLLLDGALPSHLLTSLARLLAGVTIGALLGTLTGITLARIARADNIVSPTIQFMAGLPVVVWMPVAIVVFGTGEAFKIGLATLATFFIVHVHLYESTSEVALGYLELAALFEKTPGDKLLHVLLPSTLPALFTSIRISLVIGWIVLFFVEYAVSFQGSEGLGWFIADARQVGRVEDEFAGMLMLGLSAFTLDSVIAVLQRWLSRWNQTARTTRHSI